MKAIPQHDEICDYRRQWTFDNWVRRLVHPPEKILGSWVGPGMTVADLGCGTGHFSLGMAQMVGRIGKVQAVDVQQGALDRLAVRAERLGVAGVIEFLRCEPHDLGLQEPLDFALACWVVHETLDPISFFAQVFRVLKPGGRLLMMEPRFHVSEKKLAEEIVQAEKSGLIVEQSPSIRLSRSVLLCKNSDPVGGEQ